MKQAVIVAACHVPVSDAWVKALAAQQDQADVIIVDDSNGNVEYPSWMDVYDYARQKATMGDELYSMFEQFHKSSACKQFGLWAAYKMGYKTVIVIDSDCIVPDDFVSRHMEILHREAGHGPWSNPLFGTGYFSRGYPYSMRHCEQAAHMGLWTHELDLYGTDRIGKKNIPRTPDMDYFDRYVALRPFFPLSGMNVSFRHDVIPYMLFLPEFNTDDGELFTRHDDIWGGYIFQKVMQAKKRTLSYGHPMVFHDTVVIPEEDAAAEVPMIKYEDEFYLCIDKALEGRSIDTYPPRVLFEVLARYFGSHHSLSGLADAFMFQSKAYADV